MKKLTSVAVLIALGLSVLAPITIIHASSDSDAVSLITLNVCTSSTNSIIDNPDMPLIHEQQFELILSNLIDFSDSSNIPVILPSVTIQLELPPKV